MSVLTPPSQPLVGEGIELTTASGLVSAVLAVAEADPEYHRWSQAALDSRPGSHAAEAIDFGVVLEDERAVIGLVELRLVDQEQLWAEMGYWIAEPKRGRGIATAAVRLLTDWVEGCMTLAQIHLLVHPDNDASLRVAAGAGYEDRGRALLDVPVGDSNEVRVFTWMRT